jgi:hypothetical protein
VASYFERSNKPLGSIKSRKFLEKLTDYQPLENDSMALVLITLTLRFSSLDGDKSKVCRKMSEATKDQISGQLSPWLSTLRCHPGDENSPVGGRGSETSHPIDMIIIIIIKWPIKDITIGQVTL